MKKDKEKDKKKKRVKRAVTPAAPTEAVSAPAETSSAVDAAQPVQPADAPLTVFLRVAGGKWKIRILWALRDGQSRRYGEVKTAVSGITDMMLSQSLKELYADKLLQRQQYQEIPPKVEYRLTPSGAALIPALGALCEWEQQMRGGDAT